MVRFAICGVASCLMLGPAFAQRQAIPEITQEQPDSRTVLGVGNEYLAAGAEALRIKEYDEGIRLTKIGLRLQDALGQMGDWDADVGGPRPRTGPGCHCRVVRVVARLPERVAVLERRRPLKLPGSLLARDLFDGVVRPNRRRPLPNVYYEKAARWSRCWPTLTVLPWA